MPTTTTAGATAKASRLTDEKLRVLGDQLEGCEATLKELQGLKNKHLTDEVLFRAGIMLFELRTMVYTMTRD